MKSYVRANREVYNAVANEYHKRLAHYSKSLASKQVNEPFIEVLKKNFKTPKVLELGPGSGLDLQYLEAAGCQTFAIDVAPKIINFAKKISPKTKFFLGDFSEYNFKNQKYSGIFAKAFIHLFPTEDALMVFKKMWQLLVPGGFIYISTTKHKKPSAGFYLKKNFKTPLRRYRKKWSESELKRAIRHCGFTIVFTGYHFERDKGKHWMYFVAQKNARIAA